MEAQNIPTVVFCNIGEVIYFVSLEQMGSWYGGMSTLNNISDRNGFPLSELEVEMIGSVWPHGMSCWWRKFRGWRLGMKKKDS